MEEIASRVEQIAAASEQITASASSMEASIGEVAGVAEESSASTEQVSASTEETSASTKQIAASAQELASNAEQLNKLVGRFQVSQSGSSSEAETMASALEAHRAWGTRLRQAIDTGTSSMSVEEAGKDDRCGFGKWLHGPGSFRDRDPERWQQLHDLHEQFHRHASEVLALPESSGSISTKGTPPAAASRLSRHLRPSKAGRGTPAGSRVHQCPIANWKALYRPPRWSSRADRL